MLYICHNFKIYVYLYSGKDQWEFPDEPNKTNTSVQSTATGTAKNPSQGPSKTKFDDIPLSKGGIAVINCMLFASIFTNFVISIYRYNFLSDVILNDTENENAHDPYQLFSSPPKVIADGPKTYGKSGTAQAKLANAEYSKK